MSCRYLNRFILTLVGAAALTACSGSVTKPNPPAAVAVPTAADTLATEALAVYHLQRDGSRAWNLISAATKQSPARIDLAFLQMSLCQLIEGCPPETYEARVRKLDPGNAAVWMRALEEAQVRREPSVEMQVLEAIGRGQRFDVYWNPLVVAISNARIANGTRAEVALNETIQWLGDAIVPPLQPVALSCARTRTIDQQSAERCHKVARVLMNGDTYLAESLGVKLAQQVISDANEQAKLEQRSRASRFRWWIYREMTSSQIEKDKFSLELLDLMRKLRREQDVHLAVVRWAGRPITPPADWTDE